MLDQVKDMTTERERFEAWCRTTNSMPCEHKWIGWQAALSAPPGYVLVPVEPPTITAQEARDGQRWSGMDGATAHHLIERHAENWSEVGLMMNAWLDANRAAAPKDPT